jgi:hypothetical protein
LKRYQSSGSGVTSTKTVFSMARCESVYLEEMIGRRCRFWLSMVWRNRVAMLSSLWSGGALPPLLLRSCQKLTSRAATDRARHLKRAIPCYRVSNCGKLQRASRSPNQYFSIHAAYVRNASFEVLILTVILPCRWWQLQCGTHGLSNLIYIIPKYIIRMRVASNLFAGRVVLFLPQRKRCLDCHDIRPGLDGATSSPIGGGGERWQKELS